MSTYLQIGNTSVDPEFQHRGWGCVIVLSSDIMNSTLGSGTIQDENGYDLTSQESKDQALAFVSGTAIATQEIIACFLLLNSDIANNPLGSPEASVLWQLKQVWKNLVDIGYEE